MYNNTLPTGYFKAQTFKIKMYKAALPYIEHVYLVQLKPRLQFQKL